MKTRKGITYKEFKDWCESHNIPDDTPLAIYDGDRECGYCACGIVVETPDLFIDPDELEVEIATETSGISCYCCNTFDASLLTECNSEMVLVLTDGNHYE